MNRTIFSKHGIALSVVSITFANVHVQAQNFAALVSPPRFELRAKPGEKIREVMEISNADARAAKWHVRTADWTFDKNANVTFYDALQPGSCRPWVAIEKKDVLLPSGAKYRYRFEVTPPADAPDGECRFAMLIEGDEMAVQTPSGPAVPVVGRIGVIVYVTVGKGKPELEVVRNEVAKVGNEMMPVLMVKNTGNAHGRLSGFLSGTDASGKQFEFAPATFPVLPGETRSITLTVNQDKEMPVKIVYPLTIRGNLEWADKTVAFEHRFAP